MQNENIYDKTLINVHLFNNKKIKDIPYKQKSCIFVVTFA